MSPDNLLQDEGDGDEMDILEEENNRMNQAKTNHSSGLKQGVSGDTRRDFDRYNQSNNDRNPFRPKTGHRNTFNVDSSYYLDDPNY